MKGSQELIQLANGRGMATAYGHVTMRPEWGRAMEQYVPMHMHQAMLYWVAFGMYPGGFLAAVLENDLFGALGRADGINLHNLANYGAFLSNYAPNGCFGSKDKAMAWHKAGGLVGRTQQEEA